MVVARDGGIGSWCLVGSELQLGKMKMFWVCWCPNSLACQDQRKSLDGEKVNSHLDTERQVIVSQTCLIITITLDDSQLHLLQSEHHGQVLGIWSCFFLLFIYFFKLFWAPLRLSCSTWDLPMGAQQLWHAGLVAGCMLDPSTWTRDRTHVLCVGRSILSLWVTREVPGFVLVE